MKEFCQNPLCESPAVKTVPVSVDSPSDQKRRLCATCQEAYTWGVQHGKMTSKAGPALARANSFLRECGFVILTHNEEDPSQDGPFEAWAYRGPLDFGQAEPVLFGIGRSVREALTALDELLGSTKTAPAQLRDRLTPMRLTNREVATMLAALRFHQDENLQAETIPDQVIGRMATGNGQWRPLCREEVEVLCARLKAGLPMVTSNAKPDGAMSVAQEGLHIEPPTAESGDQALFRVVYVIDLGATCPEDAARRVYRIMADRDSLRPVLDVLDHSGQVTRVDLSITKEQKGGETP